MTRFGENPPIADAGSDLVMYMTPFRVSLDGRGSFDPDGDTLTYSWVQTGGSPVSILGANTERPRVYVPPFLFGDLEFELIVTGDNYATLKDRDTVRLICGYCGPL